MAKESSANKLMLLAFLKLQNVMILHIKNRDKI